MHIFSMYLMEVMHVAGSSSLRLYLTEVESEAVMHCLINTTQVKPAITTHTQEHR